MEVRADIDDRAVYMAGERLSCTISLRNSNEGPESDPLTLAWLSAQIHCHCQFDDTLLRLPQDGRSREGSVDLVKRQNSRDPTTSETSFMPTKGESGLCSISREAVVLACDVSLNPGETKQYVYSEVVPTDSPPSYRGHMVKYSYKLTVGAQQINGAAKLLKIPFRVLNVPESSGDFQSVVSPNPYLQEEDLDAVMVAFHRIMAVTAQRSARSFSIASHKGVVVRCLPMKDFYRLGEEVSCTLDFSSGVIPCQQVSIAVECEENVPSECWANHIRINPAVKTYSKRHEFCLHTKKLQCSLPIPLTATPSFTTNLVIFSWKLHFEFVLSTKPAAMSSKIVRRISGTLTPTQASPPSPLLCPDELRMGSPDVPSETLSWDLPIEVLPSHPSHVAVLAARQMPQSIIL
eukprot:m.2084 g.2084  ORF g.2084 m.2084 type:complete len:405 (+) comp8273_c0_seq1:46-1260(+)